MYSVPVQMTNEWCDTSLMYVRDEHLNEFDLQRRWNRLAFPVQLQSLTGKKILVIKGGEFNDNAGPDFLNGVILVDGEVKYGDIEIHIHEAGWHEHGHCTDDRYSNVILHLVDTPHKSGAVCSHKGYVPQYTAVLKAPAGKAADKQSLLCRTTPLADDSPIILETLGWKRLVTKSQEIGSDLETSRVKTVWYIRMLRAMGYGQNVQQMMNIAEKIPYELALELSYHLSEEQLVDFVSGFTGFAAENAIQTPVWDDLHTQLQIDGLAASDWRPMKSRPSNHPVIRLSLLFRNLPHWHALLRTAPLHISPGSFVQQLYSTMSDYSRYRKFFPEVAFTLGKSRAIELLVNVYIPLWLHLLKSNSARDLYEWALNLPAIPLYYQLEQFIRSSHWKSLYPSAYMKPLQVQGLLWLQDNYCERRFCRICPALSGYTC